MTAVKGLNTTGKSCGGTDICEWSHAISGDRIIRGCGMFLYWWSQLRGGQSVVDGCGVGFCLVHLEQSSSDGGEDPTSDIDSPLFPGD